MTATAEAKPWDFSHVLELVNSLSHLQESPSASFQSDHGLSHEHTNDQVNTHATSNNGHEQKATKDNLHGLGDFSKLWQLLGSPVESPPTSPAVQASQSIDTPDKAKEILSFKAKEILSSERNDQKTVQFQDESGVEDHGTDTVSDGSVVPGTPSLTKSQRKKRNRKKRRAQDAALAEERAAAKAATSTSETEANKVSQKTPVKLPAGPVVDTTPTNRYNLRPRDSTGKVSSGSEFQSSVSEAVKRVEAAKLANKNSSTSQDHQNGSPANKSTSRNHNLARRHSNPAPSQQNGALPVPGATPNRSKLTPASGNAHAFLPSTVQPPPLSATAPVGTSQTTAPTIAKAAAKYANSIEPILRRSYEDRHWALLTKLIADFYEDRKHLVNPMNLTTHNNDRKGIHVFVDASNIFIGFHEQLKRSRGIPWHVHVPPVDLSFDALALLMERRRPVAKRVLVGSAPHLTAYDKAKAVGYECSILEKVYKARELTERQVYFKELDHANHLRKKRAKAPPANNVATLNGGNGSGSGSGSETNTPQYAPARMIEQGVDEILHLKILESIVDTDAPGTIVLATGDAARAEYSEGFMAMAERALKKGWTVELVSWSKNISAMYTRREWSQAWGDRFRIITLDDYAEELLDM